MDHEIPHLREIFVFLAAAGLVIPTVRKLGISSVLGFLFAGLLIGPHGLNRIVVDVPLLAYVVIADVDGVRRVAELGIIFLLFMIGLELSTRQLWGMRRIVFGLGTGQVCASAAIIGAIAYAFGNSMIASAILGLCLALSSTALVMQSLTETGRLGTRFGRTAFGILLFQDLAVVPVLFLVGVAGAEGSESLAGAATRAILQAAIIIAAILAVGRIAIRPLLRFVGGSGSREVFMAAVLLIVLGTAALTAQAGLSMALGAFLAGLLFADTEYRHQVASDIEPFKGLLLGLFFMSVGMSLDVSAVWQLLGWVVLSVIGLVALKAGTLFVVSKAFRQPTAVAAETAVLLCQGGEFAFVILAAGLAVGVLDPTVGQFMLMVVILTMFLTPALSAAGRLLGRFLEKRENGTLVPADLGITGEAHVIIGGFGRVGHLLADLLDAQRISYVALDTDAEVIARQRAKGMPVVFGDASQPDLLPHLGIERAAAFVTTMDAPGSAEHVVGAVHQLWPHVPIYARARDAEHARRLQALGASGTVPDTVEASLQLCEELLTGIGFPEEAARAIVNERRNDLFAARTV
ncbi:hypothetical protein F7D01_12650 [Erythrobacter sp. 3-20A1M]|uniref:cation:proton antiporter domain-containing protein n=1 Tax=Erythrobacteraceae TaxID=335929 RepID=UPI000E5C2494|nr:MULTISPECIES: cation:proton antiporter [Erythrobacteraceae]QWC57813.1 hypothetical protein F7D01_12650 [Erythrobacter sp. 3-20A1M]